MHVENKEFVIRFELGASFPDDYQGDEDGYAWTAAFAPLAQALVGAVARTVAVHPAGACARQPRPLQRRRGHLHPREAIVIELSAFSYQRSAQR